MVGNIILYFSTLASAFRLKAPLPPYLPPAEKARQQLVGIRCPFFYRNAERKTLKKGGSDPKTGCCAEARDQGIEAASIFRVCADDEGDYWGA
jgi:hypothetical protein